MGNLILDILFPKFCFNCKKEGDYLCQDCQSLLDIIKFHKKYETRYLSDLYYPLEYKKPLIKKLILRYKYEPFIKELAKTLSLLILNHFELIDNKPDFSNFLMIPLPLENKKLKWRGFNQSEELAKEIAKSLGLPLVNSALIKTKATKSQRELTKTEREKNIEGVFSVKDKWLIQNKNIVLIDDVYTTGSTLEEAAKTLKESGAKEIVGIAIARANPEDDYIA